MLINLQNTYKKRRENVASKYPVPSEKYIIKNIDKLYSLCSQFKEQK